MKKNEAAKYLIDDISFQHIDDGYVLKGTFHKRELTGGMINFMLSVTNGLSIADFICALKGLAGGLQDKMKEMKA